MSIAGSLPAYIERMDEVDRNPVAISRDGGRLAMDGGWFRAAVDIPARSASLECPLSLHPLDSLLRVLYTVSGVTSRSFLLHSAGVVVEGRAFAVFGPSQAGKSTIAAAAAASGDSCAIGDELVALRLSGDAPEAHGTPFWDGRDVTLPLGCLVVPVKAGETSVEPIAEGEALRLMWPQVQVAGLTESEMAVVWQAAGDIAASVPALRLRFALGPRMWDDISGAIRGAL